MFLILFLVSCTGGKISKDIINYVNQDLMNISQLESLAFKHYAAVTGDNYTTDENVYMSLKEDVIPNYKRFLELLREISPEDPELKKVHGFYVRGATDIYEGFTAKMIGLKGNDEALVRLANQQIESGAQQVAIWRNELSLLIAANKSIQTEDNK